MNTLAGITCIISTVIHIMRIGSSGGSGKIAPMCLAGSRIIQAELSFMWCRVVYHYIVNLIAGIIRTLDTIVARPVIWSMVARVSFLVTRVDCAVDSIVTRIRRI